MKIFRNTYGLFELLTLTAYFGCFVIVGGCLSLWLKLMEYFEVCDLKVFVFWLAVSVCGWGYAFSVLAEVIGAGV